MASTGYQTITISPSLERFLRYGGLTLDDIAAVLRDVAGEATGNTGIFARHFVEGQAKWAPNAPATTRKKEGSRVFLDSGKVFDAITQDAAAQAGMAALFGSSADIHGTTAVQKQWVSKGLYFRLRGAATTTTLVIGFSGKLKYSRQFNAARRALSKQRGSRASISQAQAALKTGQRKWAAKGSLGYERKGGKSRHIAATGDNNLGYANLVQTGRFLGAKLGGVDINASHLATLRTSGGLKRLEATHGKATINRATARPLLPFTPTDVPRINIALTRAIANILHKAGLTANAA